MLSMIRRLNGWMLRYPLSFAIIAVSVAVGVIAASQFVQSAQTNRNTASLRHVQQRNCFVDAFQVAQGEAVLAAMTRDPARLAAALPDYDATKKDLARFNSGDRTVVCHPPKP